MVVSCWKHALNHRPSTINHKLPSPCAPALGTRKTIPALICLFFLICQLVAYFLVFFRPHFVIRLSFFFCFVVALRIEQCLFSVNDTLMLGLMVACILEYPLIALIAREYQLLF